MGTRDDKPKAVAVLTLTEAAHRLGKSATWLRKLARSGRLETLHIAGVGRVTTEAHLARFLQTQRSRGRPRKLGIDQAPSVGRQRSDTIEAVLRIVEREAGDTFSPAQHHHLVKAGLLTHRRDFPQGPEGTRAWLQALRQPLVILVRLKARGIIDIRDRALGLMYYQCSVAESLVNRALFSYLVPFVEARRQMTIADRAAAAQIHARRPWRVYPEMAGMRPADRAAVFESMFHIGMGDLVSPHDVARIVSTLPPQARLLAETSSSAGSSEPTWLEIFAKGREMDEKVDQLVQSSVTKREDGKYVCQPLGSPEEMNKAWIMTRSAFPAWLLTFDDPTIAARDRIGLLAWTVARSLILSREQTKASALGVAMGGLIASILTTPEKVPSHVKGVVSLILQIFSQPPRSVEQLGDYIKAVNRIIETDAASQDEKAQSRQALRTMLAFASDASKTAEERFQALEQLMFRYLNVTPNERAVIEGSTETSKEASE